MSFWNKLDRSPFSDAPATPADPLRPATSDASLPVAPPAATAETAAGAASPPTPPAPAPAAAASVAAPAPSSTPAPAPGDLRLGRGVRLEGKLTFSGSVRVDATFQGSIVTDGVLIVGEGGKVEAEITCGTVVVDGEVIGNIVASQGVELHASGRLRGDVEAPAFAIDRGGIFEGYSRRPGGTSSSDRRAGKHAASQHQ